MQVFWMPAFLMKKLNYVKESLMKNKVRKQLELDCLGKDS